MIRNTKTNLLKSRIADIAILACAPFSFTFFKETPSPAAELNECSNGNDADFDGIIYGFRGNEESKKTKYED